MTWTTGSGHTQRVTARPSALSTPDAPTPPPRAPEPRPTMRDIAERVGVSTRSVSRVLGGEPGVSPERSRLILEVAAQVGFRRNDLARGLRRGRRTGTIGLVLRHSSTRFYDGLIRGIDEVAGRRDALVLTAGSRNAAREEETLLALASRRVDGLVVVPTGTDHAFLRPEQAVGTPIVFVDRPPSGLLADTVLANDRSGGRSAAEHLVDHGHTRVAVVGAAAHLHTVAERLRGCRAALQQRGADLDEELVRLGVEDARSAAAAVTSLLRLPAPPTALFALDNRCTEGAVRALRAAGAEHEVALVGFDDVHLADLLDPPLTVVAHDVTAMGRAAAEQLFARIDGLEGPVRTVVLPTHVVPRGSGELPGPGAQRSAASTSAAARRAEPMHAGTPTPS